jgi:DHA2 family multidrug resistance protein
MGSFGTSITTTWWDRRASLHHAQLAEHITEYAPPPLLPDLQARGMSADQTHALINRLIDQQAFMLSFNDLFYVSAVIMLALIAVVWLARPARAEAGGAGAAAGAH